MWEVRTTGNDTNGGAFVAGATGTDYSQQDSKNPNGGTDGSSVLAVAIGTSTITCVDANFGATIVGNIVYFAGGTGTIAGQWRQVTARASATSITIDQAIAASTGMTMNVGGAITTLTLLSTLMVAGNKAFVKAGSGYTQTATPTFAQAQNPTNSGAPPTSLIGYTTTRTDGGVVSITLSTNTGLSGLNFTGVGWYVTNFSINCSSLGTSVGLKSTAGYLVVRNIKVNNFTSRGIQCTAGDKISIFDCEVTGGTSAATSGVTLSGVGGQVIRCWIHDNACTAILGVFFCHVVRCLISNNTGVSSDGIQGPQIYGSIIEHNTIYKCGRDAIRFGGTGASGTTLYGLEIRNNIFAQNTGWGINNITAAYGANPMFDGNAYYSNTAGARNNIDDPGSTNAVNAASPYINVFDVTLTGDPFVNAAANDFRLNSTTGAGAACRGTGTPGMLPGMSNLGYPDMGALQHQDTPAAAPIINQIINRYVGAE